MPPQPAPQLTTPTWMKPLPLSSRTTMGPTAIARAGVLVGALLEGAELGIGDARGRLGAGKGPLQLALSTQSISTSRNLIGAFTLPSTSGPRSDMSAVKSSSKDQRVPPLTVTLAPGTRYFLSDGHGLRAGDRRFELDQRYIGLSVQTLLQELGAHEIFSTSTLVVFVRSLEP